MIDCLNLSHTSSSTERGRAHGEHYRDKIRELYEIRTQLALNRSDFGSENKLLELADKHLPVAKDFDLPLYDELCGIAEGAKLSAAQLVVLNHYTDIRDLTLADLDDGGCSTLFVKSDEGNILGQTWDMHGSATDYVTLLEIEDQGARSVLFTITGCVGMTGINTHGLGMTINNLNSTDAVIGIVWPILVRRCLREKSALAAREIIHKAPIGSGHHYIVADDQNVFGIETSGTQKREIQEGTSKVHLHTNHALDEKIAEKTRVMPTSTTHKRYEKMCQIRDQQKITSAEDLYDAFDVVSNEQDLKNPHAVATCGAFVMDLRRARALACKGPPTFDGVVRTEHLTR